jgi:hypothetical protein
MKVRLSILASNLEDTGLYNIIVFDADGHADLSPTLRTRGRSLG